MGAKKVDQIKVNNKPGLPMYFLTAVLVGVTIWYSTLLRDANTVKLRPMLALDPEKSQITFIYGKEKDGIKLNLKNVGDSMAYVTSIHYSINNVPAPPIVNATYELVPDSYMSQSYNVSKGTIFSGKEFTHKLTVQYESELKKKYIYSILEEWRIEIDKKSESGFEIKESDIKVKKHHTVFIENHELIKREP
jgi:hypothetical protein